MGYLVDLAIPAGNSFDIFCDILNECRICNTVVRLKSFRSVSSSGNPASFVYNILSKHSERAKDCKRSVVVFHYFDLWATSTTLQEEYSNTGHSGPSKYEEYLKQIRVAENTTEKLSKCESNWTYKLLYWIRYSLIFLLNEKFSHELVCICIYGNSSTKGFFGDIFTESYDLHEFTKSTIFNDLGLDESLFKRRLSVEKCQISKQIEREFDALTNDLFQDISNVDETSYGGIFNASNLNIPFNVDCTSLNLSEVTLICGEEGSGKSTLLKAISKAWYNQIAKSTAKQNFQLSNIKRGHIFNLEYYELVSHLVGCGEAYIRDVFANARYNKPSLVLLDGIELIFENEQLEENRAIPSTVSKTLLNELSNIEEGVKFVSCTSGNVLISDLSRDFQSVVTDVILLSKKDLN
ncbi:hypothetical protein BEWA_005970 [Theileria equi strain WA]|uniref:AAA+ ATPase domain-containing protein n=1 Tax=Theileria equi strain WA TaxID=1537102 RepID=L0B226_THEEQ|nr:hypothetical protein BEWA_005970 [Theileria equi strain WA]AFZ81189.1 hypothetical protein BEWA_005970 [Theileria equi strain WA]|eukprot:XP_004830855.1 hypothetical protein BEWA_005970 [Theileria equi strain WA]